MRAIAVGKLRMRLSEMRQAVTLLDEEWELGQEASRTSGRVCAWLYLLEVLAESEKIVVAKIGNEVVGFAGYAKWGSKNRRIQKKFYEWWRKAILYSPAVKDRDELIRYNDNYDYVPARMAAELEGEVSILLVDAKYRGKGLGKKLLDDIFRLAKADGMRNLQILTDESCNFHFYEKMGCEKHYETVIENREYGRLGKTSTEKAFVFVKWL